MYSTLKLEFRPDEGNYHFSLNKKYKTRTEYQFVDNNFFYYVYDDNNKEIQFDLRKYELHFKFFLNDDAEIKKETKNVNSEDENKLFLPIT